MLRVQNRLDQARTVLDQARAKAEAMGMRRRLPEIFIALSEVKAQLGHAVEAQAASAQARRVIEYVAAHAPHELREAFLARRDVRGIMETS
ncbi:MAG TPA: hypothetical protein VF932_12605 [Anaerolineae bacterium]